MKPAVSLFALLVATPALAQDTRQLDAHEHGVGALDIAIEDTTVAMAFRAPGADIVGFEYAAKSDADLAAIDAALATLRDPMALFALPEAAGCTVTAAQAALEAEDHAHDDHDDHDDHDHDADHDDHDHDHEDHDDHDDHAEDAGHTEFHADYTLTCDNPQDLTRITFTYFATFPNAQEVAVQMITPAGARAFAVDRDTPTLDLDS